MTEIKSCTIDHGIQAYAAASPGGLTLRSVNLYVRPSMKPTTLQTPGALVTASDTRRDNRQTPRAALADAETSAYLWRLKEFVSPSVARLALCKNGSQYLNRHRSEVAVLFCDLRGFTDFVNTVTADEADQLLWEYHQCLDNFFCLYDATLDHRAGDGAMVFIGDPIAFDPPIDALVHAAKLALDLRAAVYTLLQVWLARGYGLGFGMGLSYGLATIGIISSGFRSDYTASGRIVTLASRLCDTARSGQILVPSSVRDALGDMADFEPIAPMRLKGFDRLTETHDLISCQDRIARDPKR